MNVQFRATLVTLIFSTCAWAQSRPWASFQDPVTGTVCDTVNAANAQLVIDQDSRPIIITGPDVPLDDVVVDAQGFFVFDDGERLGFVDWAQDDDGQTRLFWFTNIGTTVVTLDSITRRPSDSGKAPDDIASARCSACPLWDDQTVCGDDPDNPDDPDQPTTSINLCGTEIPITVGLISLGLWPLRLTRQRCLTRGSRP